MDFGALGNIAGMLIKVGAPILGNVLLPGIGGPLLGAAAGAIAGGLGIGAGTPVDDVLTTVAKTLGVPKSIEAITGALAEALKQGPDVLKAKFAADEAEAAAKWPAVAQIAQANAEVAKAQVDAVRHEMQAEMAAAGTISRPWLRDTALALSSIWRPLYAFEGLAECVAFVVGLGWLLFDAFYRGHAEQVDLLLKMIPVFSILLIPYMGARFGLLGYYMRKRSQEKIASTPAASGFDFGAIADSLVKLKGLFK